MENITVLMFVGFIRSGGVACCNRRCKKTAILNFYRIIRSNDLNVCVI